VQWTFARVGFWGVSWKVVVAFSVIGSAWIAAFFIRDQLKPFLERRIWLTRHWPWVVLGHKGSRDLAKLVRILGKVQEDLGRRENDLVFQNICFDLNRVTWCVWVEAMSMIALHSSNASERCKALRNLSQIDDAHLLQHVINVVNGVLNDPAASKNVTRTAEAALRELETRQEIELKRQTARGNQKTKPSGKRGRSGART
jgi:hypothetical protein